MITKNDISAHLTHAKSIDVLPVYKRAARIYDIPLEILLAKDSRETWLGLYPGLAQNNWYGSDGVSKGISQVNVEFYPEADLVRGDAHDWFIPKGAEILRGYLDRFGGNRKAALAAYNTGPTDVQNAVARGEDPDRYTTHGNYAKDVLARAEIIRSELGLGVKQALLKGVPGILILLAGGRFVVEQIKKSNKNN